uniref:Uncharacterized protein n=1 Tax=Wuchereria bancrofti TaxID=6293 RepID=A0A1I8EM38_WUCBA
MKYHFWNNQQVNHVTAHSQFTVLPDTDVFRIRFVAENLDNVLTDNQLQPIVMDDYWHVYHLVIVHHIVFAYRQYHHLPQFYNLFVVIYPCQQINSNLMNNQSLQIRVIIIW